LRLVHLSDSHLGFSAYSKLDVAEGINQREADFYRAFQEAIDKVIELRPDVVVHSGDLFDTVRPQNRAIDFALRQLIRLSNEGIETILISGNHSTPRLRETGNIFRIFEHLKHVHPVHEAGGKTIVVGDATIYAIPHSATPSLAEITSGLRPSRDTRLGVLVLHAGVMGSDTYKMDEFNEQTIPAENISSDWDYVALGHYHEFKRVNPRAYYSGSTERLSFSEAGQKKGIVEVDLDSHSAKFHELHVRDMLDMEPIDASKLTSSEILREAQERVSGANIDERIVRLVIKNVAPDAYNSLDVSAIRRMGSSALHFELKSDRIEVEGEKHVGDTQIGLLADEFKKYVASLDAPDEKKSRLMEIGMPYLMRDDE
jgi:DNA repair exonuclease SbcCD nuclease subunit